MRNPPRKAFRYKIRSMTILGDGAWRRRLPPHHSPQSVAPGRAWGLLELPRVTKAVRGVQGPAIPRDLSDVSVSRTSNKSPYIEKGRYTRNFPTFYPLKSFFGSHVCIRGQHLWTCRQRKAVDFLGHLHSPDQPRGTACSTHSNLLCRHWPRGRCLSSTHDHPLPVAPNRAPRHLPDPAPILLILCNWSWRSGTLSAAVLLQCAGDSCWNF